MEYTKILSIITGMLSGLTLFLFGMNTMSDALSKMTGGKLEQFIGKITKNGYIAFLFGTFITAIVQSSSAVSVLAVGLVNSGIMELQKAVGLLIGANLGTTATAWLLSLNAFSADSFIMALFKPSSFSPFLGIIGIGLLMFSKVNRKKNIANSLIGFAVMMLGMNLMGGSVAPLKHMPGFDRILISFSNPFLGFLCSLIFTLIIQSSDATIGILIAFDISVEVTYGTVIPLVCGAQIGTCITSLLSSVDTSNNGKRTALIQLYYNLFKNIPFLVILFAVNMIFPIDFLNYDTGVIGVPLVHSLINVAASVIYLPCADFFVKLSVKTLPYSEEEQQNQNDTLTILDPKILVNPSFALEQTRNAIKIMADKVQEAYAALLEGFGDISSIEGKMNTMCGSIYKYRIQISDYMTKLLEHGLQDDEVMKLESIQNYCKAFGRIGKFIDENVKFQTEHEDTEKEFSDEAKSDLLLLMKAVGEIIDFTVEDYSIESNIFAETILIFREEVSKLHNSISLRHIMRIHNGTCRKELSALFLNLCYGLEKIIDACDLAAGTMSIRPYALNMRYSDRKRKIQHLFRDKYNLLGGNDDDKANV